MNKVFKTDTFAIIRQPLPDYDEASGLFNIHVAFQTKETAKLMLATIVYICLYACI